MPTTDPFSEEQGSVAVGTAIASITASGGQLIRWINKEKAAALPNVEKWREEADECYRFRDGHQLTAQDEAKLRKDGRPDNAFNTTQKFIRFITGVERHTPEALIFEPIDETELGQQILGEVMTRFYDWAIAKTFGDFERSRAFDDLIVAGMGWCDSFVDRTIDPKGLIKIQRIPGCEMLWPKCTGQNLNDSRWRARESMIDRDEAIAFWPDQEMLIRYTTTIGVHTAATPRPEANKTVVYTTPYLETKPLNDYAAGDNRSDEVRVLEWQWYDNKPGVYFFDPLERQDVWYEEKKFSQYQRALAKITLNDPKYLITDRVKQSQKVYQKAFILNDRWQLGETMELPGKRFTFNCMTGYFDEEDRIFYGYMRILRDPQRFANKFFNQVIEIMGTQAKGGLLVEENAIPPNKQDLFEKKYATPGTVNEVSAGAIEHRRIMPKPLPEMPAASIAIVDFCIRAMENVTGIDPETAFGQGTTMMPGVTLKAKQKSGLLLLNQEFASLSRFRIEEGYIVMDLLKTLADDRLIRVGKPYEGAVLRLMREPFAAEYDLMLDETERDPNIRHMYAETVANLAPTLIRMNKFFPELLDYFPLPVKIRQAIKKSIIETGQQEQQMAEQGIQTHGRGTPQSPEERQAKIQVLQSQAATNVAKTRRLESQSQRDEQRAKLDAVKTMLHVVTEQSRLNLEKQKADNEKAASAMEGYLARSKMGTDVLRTAMQAQAQKDVARQKPAKGEDNG